ncbi:MAG: hypothetical protein R3F55_02550 [Alphaproteobacteria bacterium]
MGKRLSASELRSLRSVTTGALPVAEDFDDLARLAELGLVRHTACGRYAATFAGKVLAAAPIAGRAGTRGWRMLSGAR